MPFANDPAPKLIALHYDFSMANDHDSNYKFLFSRPELVRDLILGFIPDAWLRKNLENGLLAGNLPTNLLIQLRLVFVDAKQPI